jgi:serine/threonine protein phosphatase 1
MPQTYVIGDIHGAYKALLQCLDRSGFDYEVDHLICLGDVCDGWPDTKLCIDELLTIKNLTYILGNHDLWLLNWLTSNKVEDLWVKQGGAATINSYSQGIPATHIQFLEKALPYFLLENKLFVHAGFDPDRALGDQEVRTFLWDRSLIQQAWKFLILEVNAKLTKFDEVYIGHTPIPFDKPMKSCEIWMMDTGAGWSGVLSLMNVDTKQIFTSDRVPLLYRGFEGRTKRDD